jgi:hypothetical protein
MPKVIHKEDPKQPDLVGKVREFLLLKGRIDDLVSAKTEIQKDLVELVDTEGEPDEKGHLWYKLPETVEGVSSLQRQRKVSQGLDELTADKILREKGLYDRCFKQVPVLDEAEVMACLYDGLLTEEEIDEMFPKKVSYAFLTPKG